MKHRLRPQDIADYALNELGPRDRLYVESMMLGSEELREDAAGMIEMARLLEEGFSCELAWANLELGMDRRERILGEVGGVSVWRVVGKVAVGFASLAACVVFSALAPVAWSLAMRPSAEIAGVTPSNSIKSSEHSTVDSGNAVPEIPTAVIIGSLPEVESGVPTSVSDDSTGSISIPNVTVGYVEMPFPAGIPVIQVDFN